MNFSTQQLQHSLIKLINKRFRLIAGIVVVVVLALGFVLFLNPKIEEIRKVGTFNLETTKEQLRLKDELIETTNSLISKYEQLELDNLEKLSKMLPATQDIPAMFVQIEALALASGLKLNNVGFAQLDASAVTRANSAAVIAENDDTAIPTPSAPTAPKEALKEMSVTFSVSGGQGYEHLKEFLTNLESSIRLLDVQSLTYAPSGPGDEASEQYQITAVTYSLGK